METQEILREDIAWRVLMVTTYLKLTTMDLLKVLGLTGRYVGYRSLLWRMLFHERSKRLRNLLPWLNKEGRTSQ
jgi:hypothetical protein